MNDAIVAQHVYKRFGDFTAVSDLSLCVPRGCIYGFLGPNGCGKSTTIRMLTGLLAPSSGEIAVLSYALPARAEFLKTKIGYMTQKFSLYGDLTVKENLSFIAKVYQFTPKQEKRRLAELVSLYHLAPVYHQLAGSLSGGQKQRLAMAAATIHAPELLFLDEPTSAVDPENRRDFWESLFDLCEQGTTILVSTHYMDEAERCHYLAILNEGHLVANASPTQLIEGIHANIVEISGTGLRELKTQLLTLPEVKSAAQQGIRLRVLVDQKITAPQAWLTQCMGDVLRDKTVGLARPDLEDVFVTYTQ